MTNLLCRRVCGYVRRSWQLSSFFSEKQVCACSTRAATGFDQHDSYTDVLESKEDFKYVERLLPQLQVPSPPKHSEYPTPSGWMPPKDKSTKLPYFVKRTRLHNWPVYTLIKNGGTRQLTVVRKIEGDIWALEKDLRQHLESIVGHTIASHVNEVGMFIHYKGIYENEVKEWLKEKGL
ncbi:large ribosomal subunit protein mL49-like [Ptychodera flava]|uniref:large ribosomal subunit protein mL49-like n=1 Tax=Ptychodera flava TaxID=63121 RepID=UPI003969CD19